ncbi:ribosome maturation factor RimM [Hydrogenibacillus sp. N12]|nr:ribosome maturation factor RimM [Hydrogenibacillus sp. N12]
MPVRYFNVGRIVAPHGLKGEVRVLAVTDFPEVRFRPGSTLYVFREEGDVRQAEASPKGAAGAPSEPVRRTASATDPALPREAALPEPLQVEGARRHKNVYLVKFRGVDTVEAAEALRGAVLKVAEADREPLPEGTYYFDQIIGLSVVDEAGAVLGAVKEILKPGANDVWVVARPGRRDLLLPYIPDVVRAVDLEGGRIVVRLLPGLDDEAEAEVPSRRAAGRAADRTGNRKGGRKGGRPSGGRSESRPPADGAGSVLPDDGGGAR